MIFRRLSFHLLPALAWLTPAWAGATLQASESAHPSEHAEPAVHAAAKIEAPAPAEKTAGSSVAAHSTSGEVESLLKIGGNLTDRADYESAEIAFRQVLNTPGAPDAGLKSALLSLAQMHRRQGAFTKAAAIYERFLKDYPGDERTPDALLSLGRTLRSLGAHKLAIARFYNVINSTLKLPGTGFDHYQVLARTAQFEIAETHFQAGEFAEANKFYSRLRLLDLAPADRARAHFMSGYALRLQGDREGSVALLRGFIEQWPQDENVPEARYLLAVTLRELRRTQEAFATTLDLLRTEKERVATDPKRWAYWQRKTGNQLANEFFETGDTMNARAIYAGMLDLSTEPSWRIPITYQLGLCYERLGVADTARASYQAVVDAAGATPSPDLTELATMAKWRLEHLEWRDQITRQVSSFFDSPGPRSVAASPAQASPLMTAAVTP